MKRFFIFTTLVAALLFQSGCSPAPAGTEAAAPAPAATASPSPSETTTSIPAPTATPMPTATLTYPLAAGTAMPLPSEALSAKNVEAIQELARWGKGRIFDAAYSPDGKLIAIATALGVGLYDSAYLSAKLRFETGSAVNAIAFSPDGKSLVTGLRDNSVATWSTADGAVLKTYAGEKKKITDKNAPKEQVTAVTFSNDGQLMAAGSSEGIVNVWNTSDSSLLQTFKSQTLAVTRVLFSPDGQSLFSSAYDGTVRRTQLSDGKLLRAFGGQAVRDLALSKDGNLLAAYDEGWPTMMFDGRISYDKGRVLIWDVNSGKKLQTIEGDNYYARPTSIDFSPDGQSIAAGLRDYTVKIWNVANGSLQSTLEEVKPKTEDYLYTAPTVRFSPDGKNLMFAGNNIVGIWDAADTSLLQKQPLTTEPIYSVAVSPDGQTLASGEGMDVLLRHLQDGSLYTDQAEMKSYGNVAFAPDGSSIAVGLWDGTARIWPVTEQGLKRSLASDVNNTYVARVAFLPDGETVALAAHPAIELRKISDGSLVKKIYTGLGSDLTGLAFSPDASLVAFSAGEQTKLVRVEDGKTIKTYPGGSAVAFSPDGTLMAGSDYKKAVRVYDVKTGEPVLTLTDNPDNIWALQFSPDGSMLIGGLADGMMVAWSIPDGTVLKSWPGHAGGIAELAFTADGKLLISCSMDGTIRVWGMKQ